jgi:hypothetical protein
MQNEIKIILTNFDPICLNSMKRLMFINIIRTFLLKWLKKANVLGKVKIGTSKLSDK